jgi:beta propeller repeat protein
MRIEGKNIGIKFFRHFLIFLLTLSLVIIVMGVPVENGTILMNDSTNISMHGDQSEFNNQYNSMFALESDYPENSSESHDLILKNGSSSSLTEDTSHVLLSVTTLISVLTPYSGDFLPRIFGDQIVWLHDNSANCSVHFYNILDGSEQEIISESQAVNGIFPNIYGSNVVWQASDGQNTSIHLYDLVTTLDYLVVSDPVSLPSSPDIYGDIVVWSEWRYGNSDIFMKNLDSGEEMLLTADTPDMDESIPSIHGDKVVWQGYNPETYKSNIYLFNISSGETSLITPSNLDSSDEFPCIYGNFVVFQRMDMASYTYDVVLYVIDTEKTITLTPNSSSTNEDSPNIYGDKVVWSGQNPSAGTTDIYLYNITTGETYLLTYDTPDTNQYLPSVFENRVVWQQEDQETGYFDIYMVTLGVERPSLTAEFEVNTTLGGIPHPVRFSDQSSGEVTCWSWDFGDGNSSRDKDPEHTYREPGSYPVSLIVSNPFQRSGILKENVVSVGSPPLISFSSDVLEGPAPLTVRFSATSLWAPESWNWSFGDGAGSIEQNPEHTFTQPGYYNVTLNATNSFGTSSNQDSVGIEVTEGIRETIPLDIDGIESIPYDSGQMVSLNTSSVMSFTIEPDSIEVYPANGSGIQKLVLLTRDSSGFQWNGQNTISGNISSLILTSKDLFLNKDVNNYSFKFEDNLTGYPMNGTYICELWVGKTERDNRKFDEIAITGNTSDQDWGTNRSAGVNSVAFTAHISYENITNTGPATLIIGVGSDWINEYGWTMGYEVTSDPSGIRCYLDGQFIGFTPLLIPGTLPSGNHTLVLRDSHYDEQTRTLIIDKKPSIRVIRIGDNGVGDILQTDFLYHDDERNMDFFRAYSPKGLSTFGLVSTSRSGNPFQMIYLSLSRIINRSGASGGGGGGSSDSGVARSANQQTSVPTRAPIPEQTSVPIVTSSATGSETGTTDLPIITQSHDSGNTPVLEELPIIPDGGGQEGTSAMVLLKNLAVVAVVIIVTIVFYFRWKKKVD